MLELWSIHKFGIAIGIIVLCLLSLFIGTALILDIIIRDESVIKYSAIGTILTTIATIIAALGGLGALFFIGYQTVQLKKSVDLRRVEAKTQAEEFHLERRPYL